MTSTETTFKEFPRDTKEIYDRLNDKVERYNKCIEDLQKKFVAIEYKYKKYIDNDYEDKDSDDEDTNDNNSDECNNEDLEHKDPKETKEQLKLKKQKELRDRLELENMNMLNSWIDEYKKTHIMKTNDNNNNDDDNDDDDWLFDIQSRYTRYINEQMKLYLHPIEYKDKEIRNTKYQINNYKNVLEMINNKSLACFFVINILDKICNNVNTKRNNINEEILQKHKESDKMKEYINQYNEIIDKLVDIYDNCYILLTEILTDSFRYELFEGKSVDDILIVCYDDLLRLYINDAKDSLIDSKQKKEEREYKYSADEIEYLKSICSSRSSYSKEHCEQHITEQINMFLSRLNYLVEEINNIENKNVKIVPSIKDFINSFEDYTPFDDAYNQYNKQYGENITKRKFSDLIKNFIKHNKDGSLIQKMIKGKRYRVIVKI